ncbi:MAG TPA: hypothetical protein VNF47_11895 [Streptosporangiaceae bacterium]|nr:hypothetical protein [Streptosporangiaceae bacterium]
MIKCVIWDLDNTLLDGVYLESDQPPPANRQLAAILTELAGRGILHAIASRNPAEAARYAQDATGHAFAAARCGWGTKSAAITAIAAELGLATDALAFVDDDSLERAEVAFALPDVLVLAPQELAQAVTWPAFSPPVVTDEARRRGELYLRRRARGEEARAFGGSRDEFLRYCQTRVRISAATSADLPRLHELSVRTHQFNSAGTAVGEAELAGYLGSVGWRVVAVALSDRFGDDGLVGGCVIGTEPDAWQVPLLMMSCRAMGRGVIDALLAWICLAAMNAGARSVSLPCVLNPRNVPLRIALVGAGFRTGEPATGEPATSGDVRAASYVRPLDPPLPVLPDWVTGEAGA